MSTLANPLEVNPLEIESQDWPVELPDHLSASSLGLFERCPEQFRRRYLLGEKERPGAALVWGNADHKAHEHNFAQKIASHEDVKVEEVKDFFAEAFDNEVGKAGGPTEIQWDDKPSDLKDAGVRLVGVYHNSVSPYVQPIAVEKRIEIKLPGVAVPVIGYIDIETEDRIIDGKTSKAKKSKPEPHWRPAAFVYQHAVRKSFEWHIKTKTKTPAVYTGETDVGLTLPFNERWLDATAVRMQRMTQAIRSYFVEFGPHTPWPSAAPDYGWSCNYCGFRPSCAWWAE